MDQTQNSFTRVVDILNKEGYSEEQISDMIADLTKTATTKFYAEAMALFSDEELDKIENLPEEEANDFIVKTYSEKTGKDPELAMQQFLDTFAEGFLEKYYEDKQSTNA